MTGPVGRRDFLRGRFAARAAAPRALRPPFAIAEAAFLRACDACLKCVGACEAGIIRIDAGMKPVLQFTHGECSFCLDCVDACPTGALDRAQGEAFTAIASVSAGCIATGGVYCRSCADACPAGAVRLAPVAGAAAAPAIDPGTCTGCGACVAPCPVGAIVVANPLLLGEAA